MIDMKDEVSVALATFNGARYLREQLESLRAQTLLPAELVVCDDGSTDNTIAILEDFATMAPFPVRIHKNPRRLGYRRNFGKAARNCRGNLISFCDQDDVWHPRKLERLVTAFHDPEVLLAYHNARVVRSDGSFIRYQHEDRVESAALAQDPPSPFRWVYGLLQMFRSTLLQYDDLWAASRDPHQPDEILAHDQWFYFLAAVLGRIEYVGEVLLDYRQHGDNLYGAGARTSLAGRVRKRFAHWAVYDQNLASVAHGRALLCQELASRVPDKAARLMALCGNYRTLAERHERRYRTFSGQTVLDRGSALMTSLIHGDYARGTWAFQVSDLVRDVWSGVLLRQVEPTT